MKPIKRHFDARGKECLPWMILKTYFREEPERSLLRNLLLCHLVVIPHVVIRFNKGAPTSFEVIKYGGVPYQSTIHPMDERRINSFRRLYKNYKEMGWGIDETPTRISFTRRGTVIVDHVARERLGLS